MTDITVFSPLWGEWYIKELIGKGSFGAVYKAEKTEYGNTYVSAIKHISIPPENVTKESLAAEGISTDERTLHLYCDTLRDQIINEINFCYTLRGNTNIVSYEDHCIIPKSNGLGYDIFIRMELLTALTRYMSEHPMSEKDVIQLGISLCEALSVLDINHMIHRDIKPANIFVSSRGIYKLGDFGESKVLSNASVGMTVRGTYAYMSPEISKGESANITADLYSLGLVMYRLLNGNRAPFLPVNNQPVNSAAMEAANVRRMKGDALPPPAFCANTALANAVLKACAFRPQERWKSPQEMKKALEDIRDGRAVYPAVQMPFPVSYSTNSPSVNPLYSTNSPSVNSSYGTNSPSTNPSYGTNSSSTNLSYGTNSSSINPSYGTNSSSGHTASQSSSGSNKKKWLLFGGISAVLVIVGVVLVVVLSSRSGNSGTSNGVSQVSTPVSQPSISVSQPSVPVSQPSSTGGMSIGAFMRTSEGQLLKEEILQQVQDMSSMMTCDIYTEGEDTIVYEYTYTHLNSVTPEQKAMVDNAMKENYSIMQTQIRTIMEEYNTRQFSAIYRYKGTSGNVLAEYTVTL